MPYATEQVGYVRNNSTYDLRQTLQLELDLDASPEVELFVMKWTRYEHQCMDLIEYNRCQQKNCQVRLMYLYVEGSFDSLKDHYNVNRFLNALKIVDSL